MWHLPAIGPTNQLLFLHSNSRLPNTITIYSPAIWPESGRRPLIGNLSQSFHAWDTVDGAERFAYQVTHRNGLFKWDNDGQFLRSYGPHLQQLLASHTLLTRRFGVGTGFHIHYALRLLRPATFLQLHWAGGWGFPKNYGRAFISLEESRERNSVPQVGPPNGFDNGYGLGQLRNPFSMECRFRSWSTNLRDPRLEPGGHRLPTGAGLPNRHLRVRRKTNWRGKFEQCTESSMAHIFDRHGICLRLVCDHDHVSATFDPDVHEQRGGAGNRIALFHLRAFFLALWLRLLDHYWYHQGTWIAIVRFLH